MLPVIVNPTIDLTLAIAYDKLNVDLAMKKRGFGAGRWNGYGGKVKPDETIEETVRREIFEESGRQAMSLGSRGNLDFTWQDKDIVMRAHLFCFTYEGSLAETEEMLPKKFSRDKIPYENMWDADRLWLPFFLQGKSISGHFMYDENDKVLTYDWKAT